MALLWNSVGEWKRKEDKEREIDIDEIERMKLGLEQPKQSRTGNLLATHPEDLVRQRNLYLRESRLKAGKRRQLTGESGSQGRRLASILVQLRTPARHGTSHGFSLSEGVGHGN
jgi:hypothetical protein